MDEPVFVYEFDTILDSFQLHSLDTGAIGSDVTKSTQLLREAFQEEKNFLKIAAQSKKPSQEKMNELAKNISAKVQEISNIADKSKQINTLNHLKSVANMAQALMWIVAPNRPAQFVNEMIDIAVYYTNKILSEHKGEGDPQRVFAVQLVGLFKSLQEYVKDFHNVGVTWNPKGVEAGSATKGGGPPGAPPPVSTTTGGESAGNSSAALFASINKGGAVTSGLKKIDDSMKTHKNPELRASSVVKDSAIPKKVAAEKKNVTTAAKKPPVFQCVNKKWIVEYQEGVTLEITEGGLAHTLYMYKCNGVTLKIKPKINLVTIDNCARCHVVLESGLISSCEMIQSKSCSFRCIEIVPTVMLDNCDSCHVYLSQKSKDSNILTSKSITSNITLLNPDGEDVELYIPEVFRNRISGNKVISEAVVHD